LGGFSSDNPCCASISTPDTVTGITRGLAGDTKNYNFVGKFTQAFNPDWQLSLDSQYGRSLIRYRGLAGVDNDRWQPLVDQGLYNPLRDTQVHGPPAEFYDPRVRRAFTLAGDANVLLNDLHSGALESDTDFNLLTAAVRLCSFNEL